LSTNPSDRFNKLDTLIQKHGEKGIRALLLFKLLKNKVKESIAKSSSSKDINENMISAVCIKKAIELAQLGQQMPTEEDIKELLSSLAEGGQGFNSS